MECFPHIFYGWAKPFPVLFFKRNLQFRMFREAGPDYQQAAIHTFQQPQGIISFPFSQMNTKVVVVQAQVKHVLVKVFHINLDWLITGGDQQNQTGERNYNNAGFHKATLRGLFHPIFFPPRYPKPLGN
jgi:hypothetical protein